VESRLPLSGGIAGVSFARVTSAAAHDPAEAGSGITLVG
jgi:hypothetical protein